MDLLRKHILLGVSGGIAIYKSLSLLSMLTKEGAECRVVMTEGAKAFVQPLAFQTMSKHRVYSDLYAEEDGFIPHIDLTRWADVFLIAPATGNILAKMAHGLADDLLSATALASHCPILVAPAMNVYMLENPATQENLALLRKRGIQVIESSTGRLACSEVGKGRMPEADELVQALKSFFTKKDLLGKKILISAGPTRERLDAVRFLTNDSSGKQGLALAKRAQMRGAEVLLVHGKLQVPIPKKMEEIPVSSTEDMLHALEDNLLDYDALIMAAAPADFRPVQVEKKKIKGLDDGKIRTLELVDTPDILQSLSKMAQGKTMIGFATETDHVLENAREKLAKKHLDYIVVNDVSQAGAGFDGDTNIVTILGHGQEKAYPLLSKEEVADHILDLLL